MYEVCVTLSIYIKRMEIYPQKVQGMSKEMYTTRKTKTIKSNEVEAILLKGHLLPQIS